MMMKMTKNLNQSLTSSYNYKLPPELIANSPATPKDSAKLLVYDRAKNRITHSIFREILDFIPKDTQIILNNTKVIKARIFGKKPTGGKIELLLNSPFKDDFLVYIKGRVKENMKLFFEDSLEAVILKLNNDGTRTVKFYQKNQELNFEKLVKVLEKIGHIPLPPYINREDNEEDETNYQTLFAQNYGAVAAPTASLHFTDELLGKLKKNFNTSYLTLHVGAGTFKPVDVAKIEEHKIHSEFFDIPKETKDVIDGDDKILAVGTTVTRTVEFYHKSKLLSGEANIFLHPNSKPKRVNYLLTNFHLPKSTLIMLVASFLGVDKTLEIYEEAIKKGYKFYSYGDAMLII